jgi:hypothetical protein
MPLDALYKVLFLFGVDITQINHVTSGRDADLVVVVDCQIRTDDLIVHLF